MGAVMSWDHAEAVYKCKKVKGTSKTILINLAHRANDDNQCWPSRDTIAEETGLAVKTVSQGLKNLKEAGLITIDRKQYYQIYTIQMLRICTSGEVQMLRKGHSDSADLPSDVTLRDSDSADLPSDVTHLPPNSKRNSHLNGHSNSQERLKGEDDINNLFRPPRKKRHVPPSVYAPPPEHRDFYYELLGMFDQTSKFVSQFEELIALPTGSPSYQEVRSWLTAQQKKHPNDTFYLWHVLNYFKQRKAAPAATVAGIVAPANGGAI